MAMNIDQTMRECLKNGPLTVITIRQKTGLPGKVIYQWLFENGVMAKRGHSQRWNIRQPDYKPENKTEIQP
jgi:hypothetical protein